ncbi:MAG: 2-keto-4-pentenoate hydratase [Porphyrobacter sp.]|nr:2-keto-4-pentenoate hydratase [Porphyrobacter sp.]
MTSPADESAIIAGRFLAARRAAKGLDDYPGPLPRTLDEAYAIQDAAIAAWGKTIVGWKVGRVLPPLAERFGTDRLAGPIFADQVVSANGDPVSMPIYAEGFAAGEAEFLLRIGTPPSPGQARLGLAEAASLIGSVHVGIEIASSPLGSINALGPVAVVSDFGNNNGLVIGPEILDWQTSAFEDWDVTTLVDGQPVGSGQASSFPDGAIGAARFLFELLAKRGIPIEAGQWISSGAVTGVHDVSPGQRVEAVFGGQYRVGCQVEAAPPE